MIYYANDRYNATLTATYTVGSNTLEVDRVPVNTPTIVVVNLGTDSETVFEVTDKSANTLTGVRRLRGANVNLPIGSTVTCVNNEEFINQVASFGAFNVQHNSDGTHGNITATSITSSGSISTASLTSSGNIQTSGSIKTDTIEEKTSGAGVSVNNILKVDNINERTNNNNVVINGNFYVKNNGLVGIKNSNPAYELDVNGNSRLKDLVIYDTEFNSIFIRRHNARISFRLYDALRLLPSNANFRFLMDTTYTHADLSFNNYAHNLYNNYLAGDFNYLYQYLYFNGSNAYSNLDSNVFNFNTSNGLSIIVVCRYFSLAQFWSRIFDFGNGSGNNNILLAHNGTGARLEYHTFNGANSTSIGVDNFWDTNRIYIIGINHSAGTPGSTTYTEFLFASKHWNGDIGGGTYTGNLYLPLGLARTNSFLGRSNWPDGYFNGGIMFFGVIDRNIGSAAMTNFISWLRQVYF